MPKIEIVVVQYSAATERTYGTRLTNESNYESAEAAIYAATPYIREGFAVVVRPNDVKRDRDGGPPSFYEWRSINGRPFEKVQFTAF